MASIYPGTPGGPGFRLAGFPKEFERGFWENFDKRYYTILLVTFVVFYGFAFYMAFQDWSLSEAQINALKQRVIEKVYDVEFVMEEEIQEEEEGTGGISDLGEEESQEMSERGKERLEESQAQRAERRRGSQADLERRSRQMQREVAGQGILAIATAAGGAGSGNVAYSDVLRGLSGAGGVGDIGEVVEGTAGITAAGSPGERTRAAKGSGYRKDGGGTGIDDLISGGTVSGGSGGGGGGSFERRGEIKLTSENVQLTAGSGSRDPESITAAINKQSALIEYCYKQRAKVNPNLRGRVDMEIEIEPNGRVSQASILNSTLGDTKLESCIVRNVKRWRFSEVETGTVRIRVPFIF